MSRIMATTEEILEAARQLGKLIGSHDAAKKFADVTGRLRDDDDAQRLLSDYNRHASTIAEKESNGSPIEVEDKRKLEEFQTKVMTHDLLRDFQMVQMDYVDLMRRVDEAMVGADTPRSSGSSSNSSGGVVAG